MAKKKESAYESVKVKLNQRLTDLGAGLHDPYIVQTICADNYDANGYQTVARTPFVEARLKADELLEVKSAAKSEGAK